VIQLHSDALWFQTPEGELVPCSAEIIAFELVDGSGHGLDSDLIRNAAKAVLHYFQKDLGRTQVTVGDFARVFAAVLRGFGLSVHTAEESTPPAREGEADLRRLASDSGKAFELAFFVRLRAELRQALAGSPRLIRFRGLRGCAKQLAGARRWNRHCQRLSDQIVAFLRDCLSSEAPTGSCALVIR
jgi:hypothetical protein